MKKFLLVCFLYLAPVLVLGIGCSSDPETPIGAEFIPDGLNPSEPGEVFQKTVLIDSGDTSFVVSVSMLGTDQMLLGRDDDVESWMIMRPDFSEAGDDTAKQVVEAELRIVRPNASTSEINLNAYFIELTEPFEDSDTLSSIELGDTIPDETGTNVDRVMAYATPRYQLEPSLVEEWLSGDKPNNGFAVVLNEPTTTERIAHVSTQSSDTGNRPTIKVRFSDESESSYPMSADGTFCIELSSTTNLLLSDGVTRRVYVPLDLSIYDPRTFLHDARLVYHIVPDTTTGGDLSVTLYVPETMDINDPAILTGIPVTTAYLSLKSGVVMLPIRNVVSQLLDEGRFEVAMVLQYSYERTSIRRIEFYPSTAPDSLKPYFQFTSSTPAEFGK